MPLRGFFTRSSSTMDAPTPAGVMPQPRRQAAPSPEEALTLDAVYRAVSILQTAVLQLTLDVWRGPTLIDTPNLVTTPNINDPAGAAGFWAETVAALALRGNAYWHVRRGTDGSILNLDPINPTEVMPWADKNGRTRYAWRAEDWTSRDITHLRLLRVPGRIDGLGPIQAAAAGLRGHLDVARYGSTWFETSGVPSGVLSTDQALTAAQAADWKRQWHDQQRQHGTAVLGNGLRYSPLSLKPSEVQWLESQRFGITSIARMFGIPSRHLLVALEGNSTTTYANAEQEDMHFLRYTLMVYLRQIELAMTGLLPRGQTARFNVDALRRTDTKTRYEAHRIAIEAGFLTINEVRAIEGLTPITQAAAQETPA